MANLIQQAFNNPYSLQKQVKSGSLKAKPKTFNYSPSGGVKPNLAGGGSPNVGGSGGGGGGGISAEQKEINKLLAGFGRQKSNIFGTAKEAARSSGVSLKGSILDFVNSLRSGQTSIDERGIQNELARRQGNQAIQSMVGRGIRSGGVMLAGGNAADSSASEAISRAYGDIGRRELSGVLSDYVLENRGIGQSQDELGIQRKAGVRKIKDSRKQAVNNIVIDARGKLAALDAAMLDADVGESIKINKEKNKIRNQVSKILNQYNSMLKKKTGGIKALSKEGRRAQAAKLALAGIAPENSFDFTDQVPMQFQETGPVASELPLFSRQSFDDEEF